MDQVELNETRNKLEEREGELKVCLVKVKSQEGEVDRLNSLLNVTNTKLTAAEEENKLLSEDLERKNENEDEQIRRDMNIRNEAVKEKNMAWIELSQTKVCFANERGKKALPSLCRLSGQQTPLEKQVTTGNVMSRTRCRSKGFILSIPFL